MASAGASIIQVYTHFGYRGVGTARLLKDEISSSLLDNGPATISANATWKGQIGKEYKGQAMGWNEERLNKDADKLKSEARGLGDMLRKAWEEDDLERLVREAEAALGTGSSSASGSGSGSGAGAGAGGSRDNLAGAANGGVIRNIEAATTAAGEEMGQLESQIVRAIEALSAEREASRQQDQDQASPGALLISETTTNPTAQIESEPIGGPLGPIVVPSSSSSLPSELKYSTSTSTSNASNVGVPLVDQPTVGLDTAARDGFRDQAKSGQRRLV